MEWVVCFGDEIITRTVLAPSEHHLGLFRGCEIEPGNPQMIQTCNVSKVLNLKVDKKLLGIPAPFTTDYLPLPMK